MLGGLLGFPALTGAAGLTISPVVVEIDNPRKAVAITVNNGSDHPITLQADTKTWRQLDNTDQYGPTDELLVVPAIVQIPPNASQVFRIALRRPAAAPSERTYRLILEDISEEQQPSGRTAVAFRFTHNLPVMVAASGGVVSAARWSACASRQPEPAQQATGTVATQACVKVLNAGNRRVKVQSLTITGDGWQHVMPLKGATNILSGAAREWHVPLSAAQTGAVRGVQLHTAQGTIMRAEDGTLQAAGKRF